MRDGLSNDLLAAFVDNMRRSLDLRLSEYEGTPDEDDEGEDSDQQGERVTVVELAGPGSVIADRLDTLGFTPAVALELLGEAFAEEREQKVGFIADPEMGAELRAHYDAEVVRLDGYTAEQWIEDVRAAASSGERGGVMDLGSLAWLLDIAGFDPRVKLRAALLAWPEAGVRLDVTDDWDAEQGNGCSAALETLRVIGAEHAPIVVLTEGRTDVAILQSALELLYPHLTDLIRFMDFGQRPVGGAGPLVNMVRAFAASGIANRVVALFDYDTAATDALRNLDLQSLPTNIYVRQYPELGLASRYPTLGPPAEGFSGGRLDVADVNGLACSIELYLGRDVLSQPDGTFRPVQWRSYISGMRQYQGEVMDKASLMDAYKAKVAAAKADSSMVTAQDWTGLQAIIKLIIDAASGI